MPSSRVRTLLALGAAALTGAASPSLALDTPGTPSPVTGNATWFTALGSPYGGCGLPQSALDSQRFVALNVYATPGDYGFYRRPLSGADLARMGLWSNGHNCGRWVRVTLGDDCTGVNDGARNQPFCRNGAWVSDAYNGATLDMVVADSCGDDNGWCRDDPYHLDLAQGALNLFQRGGVPVGDLYPAHWNNRRITWEFIPAPDYGGDITIGFLQGAQTWWGAIAVTHLPDGIHGVEYERGGAWIAAEMNGDMGQAFVVKPLVDQGREFRVRVRDAADRLVFEGRTYTFSLPDSCPYQCSEPFTPVTYTTSPGEASSEPVLFVDKAGVGVGTVRSTPLGIDCGATCAMSYAAGTTITLTATPGQGSVFAGWSGACSGTGACVVSVSSRTVVTATFAYDCCAIPATLTVTRIGPGSGTVATGDRAIDCGTRCANTDVRGKTYTLTAQAAEGSTFTGWSGACAGTGACVLTVNEDTSVTAAFGGPAPTPCAGPVTFTGSTGNLDTAGAVCLRTSQAVNGWGCSSFAGRTVSVNGGAAANACGAGPFPLPRQADGYTYFSVTAGTYPWATLYTW